MGAATGLGAASVVAGAAEVAAEAGASLVGAAEAGASLVGAAEVVASLVGAAEVVAGVVVSVLVAPASAAGTGGSRTASIM